MIKKDGRDVRVERVEWRARANAGAVVLIGLLVVAYVVRQVSDPVHYALVGVLALVMIATSWFVYRRRLAVIITPRDVRFVSGGGGWSIDRHQIGSVQVLPGMGIHLVVRDRKGGRLGSASLAYFSAQELREAFRRSGIPTR